MDGIEVLENIQKTTDAPVVMISGHGTIETAVEAIRKGAYDFIAKPLDLNRLLITLRNAMDKSRLVTETKALKRKVSKQYEMIGESPAITKIKDMIERVAATDARVLITGESGTGKELVARWLHEKSNRADGPFVEVNCAAIPSELIESVLFGHEKGSFTSAIKQRKGDFEQATNGTIFLDEIGDMSLSAQAKVLRVLQENKIMRDLYHRLSVILIKVPSLNERENDIPILANYFVEQICESNGRPPIQFTDEALEEMKKIKWTGNIRELRNVVERMVILCDQQITVEDVQMYAQPSRR